MKIFHDACNFVRSPISLCRPETTAAVQDLRSYAAKVLKLAGVLVEKGERPTTDELNNRLVALRSVRKWFLLCHKSGEHMRNVIGPLLHGTVGNAFNVNFPSQTTPASYMPVRACNLHR